jgi:hypothetical protein
MHNTKRTARPKPAKWQQKNVFSKFVLVFSPYMKINTCSPGTEVCNALDLVGLRHGKRYLKLSTTGKTFLHHTNLCESKFKPWRSSPWC